MKKALIFVLTLLSIQAFGQDKNHQVEIYFVKNINFENSLYIDFDEPDFEIWTESKAKLSFGADYTYFFNDFVGFGLQWELENIKLDDFYLGEVEATRNAGGVHLKTIYPATPLHGTYGAFFNTGSITSDDFDNSLVGIEYGMTIGPEYIHNSFSVALLFHGQFCGYFSSEEAPEAGLLMYPRLSLRIGYSF